jgi:hypothetical protein
MRKLRKTLACATLAALFILPAQAAFALDLSFDLGFSDKAHYRYQSEAGPRFRPTRASADPWAASTSGPSSGTPAAWPRAIAH